VGGALADRFGGVRTLMVVLGLAAVGLTVSSFRLAAPVEALAVILFVMGALGAGNGAVFQLAPQRFGREIGVITGLVGAMGGVGGFYLATTLGLAKQITGAYQPGFLGFAALALIALVALAALKGRWRARWPSLQGANAAAVRV
jgi:NNP family nitrate/nitrite transporter-like MFS transporter